MNNSVGSAIEKIKLQEQDNEIKLKEKREYEATVTAVNRAIKEAIQHTEKTQYEHEQLHKKIDSLQSELVIEKTRRDALLAQLELCVGELEELKKKSDQDIAKVWELRTSLCSAVHLVADECDVRSLLIKPMHPEFIPVNAKKCAPDSTIEELNDNRLKTAIERRKKAISERDRLRTEPEVGEEFVSNKMQEREGDSRYGIKVANIWYGACTLLRTLWKNALEEHSGRIIKAISLIKP